MDRQQHGRDCRRVWLQHQRQTVLGGESQKRGIKTPWHRSGTLHTHVHIHVWMWEQVLSYHVGIFTFLGLVASALIHPTSFILRAQWQPRVSVALYKPTATRPYRWRQHQWTRRSQSGACLEPSSLLTSIHGIGRYSASYWRRKLNTSPATNPPILNGDLPECAGLIVAQASGSNIWLDLRRTAWDGAHSQHCWSGQELETRETKDLGQNQILVLC